MAKTISPIAWWPQTKGDFGIVSAATALVQDTITRWRNTVTNIVKWTKNTIFNLFK